MGNNERSNAFALPELAEGWVETLMGQIADVIGGGTPSTKVEDNFSEDVNDYPWLTPADLSGFDGLEIAHGSRYLTEKGLKTSSAKLMPKGAVLMSSRAPIGYTAVAANEICTNQGFKSFVCHEEIEPRFVLHWLRFARPIIESMGSGSTFTEISGSRCKEIPIIIPPLAEQRRIVAKVEELLAEVNAARDRLAKVPAILKRFRQSVLAAACSGRLTEDWRASRKTLEDGSELAAQLEKAHEDAGGHRKGNAAPPTDEVHDLSIDELPVGWGLADLRAAVCPDRPITYGILKPGPDIENGIPYVRVADFPNDKLNLEGIRRTTSEIEKSFARARLRPGDILLSIRGTVGRVCIVPQDLDNANITQDTARLSIQPTLDIPYVTWFLRAPPTQRRMQKAQKGVAVRGINIGDVRALQLPVPPLSEQKEIVRRIERLFSLADTIEAQVLSGKSQADRLTSSVLAKAFRGELVPTEAELAQTEGRDYEPASVLLERIQAIKQEKKPGKKASRPRASRKSANRVGKR